MKCTNCSEKITRSTKFCPECGVEVVPLIQTPPVELSFLATSLQISEMMADITFEQGTEQKIIIDGPEELKQSVCLQDLGAVAVLSAEILVTDFSPFTGGGNVFFGGSNGFNEINGVLCYKSKAVDLDAGKMTITVITPPGLDVDIKTVLGDIRSKVTLGDFVASSIHSDVILGDVQSLDLDHSGDWDCTVGDVGGDAELDFSGAIRIAIGNVKGDLEVDTSGACFATIASVMGDVNIDMSGAGAVQVKSGTSGRFKADISGAAKALHFGTVSRLDGDVSGMGKVWAAACTGKVKKDVSGMGSVSVG